VLRALKQLLGPGGQIWILDDAAEASPAERKEWVRQVWGAAKAGALFRGVFWLESRFLAYSHGEVKRAGDEAGLRVAQWSTRKVFFVAKMVPDTDVCTAPQLRPSLPRVRSA
jgi:hypothetical protein